MKNLIKLESGSAIFILRLNGAVAVVELYLLIR